MSVKYSSDYAKFAEVLKESRNIVALTGAGVSAESGIPVFRDAKGGLWRTHRATDLASPHAFKSNPSLVWEFYHYRREVAFTAQPNPAHVALTKYEELCKKQGRTFTIITQNVDGLHTRCGSKNVIELHGSLDKVICTKCKQIEVNTDSPICEALRDRGDPKLKTWSDIPVSDLPKCKNCNSLARPFIIWFGEHLDETVLNKSKDLMETCDLCLVIGTSSVVYPAAMFAPMAAERGVPVAEFNTNEFPANDIFQFHFPGPCGNTLPKALRMDQ